MKNETRSRHSVPNVSLRIGRTSLRANRGSTAWESPESKLTRRIAGPTRGLQTDRMLGLSVYAAETQQKRSTRELTRANEAMRKCLDGLSSVAETGRLSWANGGYHDPTIGRHLLYIANA